MIDFSWIYDEYFSKKLPDPEHVNYGYCYVWAWIAHVSSTKTLRKKVVLCADGGGYHAFVRVGDRVFDSESPRGAMDWRLLRSYLRMDVRLHTMTEFRSHREWLKKAGLGQRSIESMARDFGWTKSTK